MTLPPCARYVFAVLFLATAKRNRVQCHLSVAKAETVVLHVSPGPDGAAHALDYFLDPIPHDGSCPPAFLPGADLMLADAIFLAPLNTTIGVKTPRTPVS
jgi:hypothetical protein